LVSHEFFYGDTRGKKIRKSIKKFQEYDTPKWTRDVFIDMMMMSSSPEGIVEYSDMRKRCGKFYNTIQFDASQTNLSIII